MHESRPAHGVLDSLPAIARRWRIVVPFVVATPIVVVALTATTPATYQSSADVVLDRKGQAISGLRDLEWYSFDAARAVRTQIRLARAPEIATQVRDAAEREGLNASGLRGRSSVTEDGTTDVMTFNVRHSDPDVAARIATLYAEQYIAHRRALDTRALRKAIAVVSAQLASSRAQGVDPSAYAHLVQSKQQLHTGLATIAGNARLVRPGGNTTRIGPEPWDDVLPALALGLIVGLGLAALANVLDVRARTAHEIADQLGLPILGRLPLEDREPRSSVGRALLRGEDTDGAEAIRLLRANLALDLLSREHSSVMVTSSVAGEGKSTTAANLAVALALAGRNVVLVDLDLRHPAIGRIFELPKAPGITELARGTAGISEAAHDVSLNGVEPNEQPEAAPGLRRGTLRVVPVGDTLATDPESFLTGSGLRAALDSLREDADVVLLDSPPLLQGGDALELSKHADWLLFAASMSRYRPSYAPVVARLLSRSSAVPIGLVVIGELPQLDSGARAPAGSRDSRRGFQPVREG